MTIEEAIKRYTDNSEHERTHGNLQGCLDFKQLTDWLRELKKYRIAHWKLRDMDYEYDFDSMFGDNPMFYGEKVWDLFGDIDASVEYEVMGYEEVNTDG